ncbi:Bifunctional glutamine synthetase adenylyltransferase/adenylyl-removing enzyme [Pseudidiomarina piscicola]|uniref:Bifunctional glutamine synthetase adenylyltransferase/adenylyl-removing enzyme n=1 Tax=Pseudidiomarina piscicola TaxID=2614830 RepID=A0A6S6WPF9_9GAMM|nr:bifunctional [glutamate--ammonia ligase]-adenylyl-L-tyrosine phosphorylase/[glutamate--ammonia-ligase] adenylyltransferase [Pseudidiomarina piscicola]CAB0151949.1 Bifunctional glutamine synthetase adenylyltransferase/adenylyl-removing enzyme [Pseudidiomarina piscicola]VZT41387.1 Bifunctional glutamine synthetase adenylyltransferase/adenylyl-removing enzyme [Pseudomonas aeruginosa]
MDKVQQLKEFWCATSEFIASVWRNDANAIVTDNEGQVQLPAPESYAAQLQQALTEVDSEEEAQRVLRRYRQRWFASLAAADLANQLELKQTLQHISAAADAFIIAARDWLYPQLCQRYGVPRDHQGEAQPLLIIGMGKLGGYELNFSSDIDLIFCYPEQGETDHPRKPIETNVFFTKLVQGLVTLLDSVTADGRVFRVDLRLRPFGQSGPVVTSLAALEYYYQEQGRDWERYAMVKARLIGAAEDYQQQLSQLLRPFVYRRYIDFSAIDALRKMKALITQETRRQGVQNNLKLGPGGIREIEFIAQTFQLIRGGQERQLQTNSVYQAYAAIRELELLPVASVNELLANYEFLRKVEHVLQQLNDEQTQSLPDDPEHQQRVADAFQTDWQTLYQRIRDVMEQVHHQFQNVIGDNETDEEDVGALQLLWQDMVEDDTALDVLHDAGLNKQRAQQIWALVADLRYEVRRRGSGPRGRKAMAKLVPLLLQRSLPLADAEVVLERVFKVLRRIMSRTAYVELLVENSGACEQLIKLCRASEWMTQHIANFPILLDELIDPQHLYELPKVHDYPAIINDYMVRIPEQEDDLEAQMNALRQARQSCQLKIAAADISGALPLMHVSDHLSFLAEAIIEHVVQLAWQHLVARHGCPPGRTLSDTGLAVIAYGKLGGLELSYSSDLDLVFVTDGDYQGETDGVKPLEVQQFYLRLAQRILHLFTTRTMIGVLYEVDMRLRPSGKAGLLVSRLSTYASYLHDEAWTWELQALVRARPVYGSQPLREKFNQLRQQQLSRPRDAQKLAQQVASMREKMRSHNERRDAGASTARAFDLKQGVGGITDIEFLVQFLVLRFSAEHPELAHFTDNVRCIEVAGKLGILTVDEAQQLTTVYIRQRQWLHQLALDDSGSLTYRTVDNERQVVSEAWQKWFVDASDKD